MIDEKRLLAFLKERAQESGTGALADGGMLVLYAAYEGLAERIRNGEFNKED